MNDAKRFSLSCLKSAPPSFFLLPLQLLPSLSLFSLKKDYNSALLSSTTPYPTPTPSHWTRMPFPSHLQGLNLVDPSPYDSSPSISDDDLARTLALWTNVDFSYDDGGIGLESAQKLLEQDAAQAAGLERGQRSTRDLEGGLARREHHSYQPSTTPSNGHFGPQHHNQVQEQDHSSSSSFLGHQQHVDLDQQHQQDDPLDPFGFNSTLFALHQQATANAALAASPGSILPQASRYVPNVVEDDEDARPNKRKNMSRSESVLSSTASTPLKNEQNDEVLAPEDE